MVILPPDGQRLAKVEWKSEAAGWLFETECFAGGNRFEHGG